MEKSRRSPPQKRKITIEYNDDNDECDLASNILDQIFPDGYLNNLNSLEKIKLVKIMRWLSDNYDFSTKQDNNNLFGQ